MNNFHNVLPNSKLYEKYEIIKVIGSGGMGAVFLVKSKIYPNQYFALKYRHNDLNEANKQRFIAELKLISRLKSNNIPKLYDSYVDDSEQYYVMEYIEGQTLYNLIKQNGFLQTRLAINYIKQIARALGELHSANIIHRDIKSQNILVDKLHKVKVIDFGISISDDSQRLTKTNAVVCSPYYAAPEFAIKNAEITKAADIYSLGVMLYEMLVGDYPFRGSSEEETILMHKNSELPNPRNFRDMPQSLSNVIIKATAKNPKDRYETVWDFIKDIETVLTPERALEKPLSTKTAKNKISLVNIINSKTFLAAAITVIVVAIVVLSVLLALNIG
ncbi:Kae1-associated serine/threonine protein kinase [Mycoplasma sp. NEAQ87857]|uniref:serine/threonine-protein kinase n=1 Tax=Mycoplasma sp. NEAQ87857 TaxID=2683967 RepID=UPI0013180853|nr:serine/threonine-protein kinase [Mycoplasma sp. NEAQ87857]QGZ97477.1 Kae1-associated serine/threonine protein kinase [Mycoplasma sp. NEAQ87857]